MNIRDNHRDFFPLVYPVIKLIVRNTRIVSWRVVRSGFVLQDTPAWEALWEAMALWGRDSGCGEEQDRLEETPVEKLGWPKEDQPQYQIRTVL